MNLVSNRRDDCQRFSNVPIEFRVSLPTEENLDIGENSSTCFMFLDGEATVHVIDISTNFFAATFLESAGESYGQAEEGNRETFSNTSRTMYIGYSNRLQTDRGSVFISERRKQVMDFTGIQLRLFRVQAHICLDIGEKYPSSSDIA